MKNKLIQIKKTLEKQLNLKKILEKKQETISKKLEKLTDEQVKLIEYNNYKNNSHVAVAVIVCAGTFFATKNVLNQELVYTVLACLTTSSIASISTHKFFSFKRKKLKEKNPTIDFENSNIDENQKKIQNLIHKQIKTSQKLKEINNITEKCGNCYNELIQNNDISGLNKCNIVNNKNKCEKEEKIETKETSKQKILVMTIE